MSLADDLEQLTVPTPPPKYRQRAEYDTHTGKGEGATGPVRGKITDERQMLELAGFDPDEFRIVGKISQWTKTHHDREDTYSFFFQVERTTVDEDDSAARILASLIQPIEPVAKKQATGLPMVVCLADGQIGKDGPDATLEELDARWRSALAQVAAKVEAKQPSVLILADNGDPIEGITSSAPNQIATNTLELPDQLRLWQRRLTETILTLSRFAGRTMVAAVPSNHGEIRNQSGKVGYGDYGIGVARTVEEAFELLTERHDLTFHYPATKHCPASSIWQDFFVFEVGDGGVGEAGVDVGGSVPGDRFVRADVVVVVSVRADLVDELESIVDLLAEQPLVPSSSRSRVRVTRSDPAFGLSCGRAGSRGGWR